MPPMYGWRPKKKGKEFLLSRNVKKHGPQKVPKNADEYLEAGVDLEESGEKWRGGDPVKSTRFFIKAVVNYDEGLQKFPQSFDLAYNKARVQYELTQYPKLLAQLPGPLVEILNTALASSRFAMTLERDNADVLFNTAQVLTSLVEAISNDRSYIQGPEEGFTYLKEAVELFQRCLILQESSYEEFRAQQQAYEENHINNEDAGISPPETDIEMDTDERDEAGLARETTSNANTEGDMEMEIDEKKEEDEDRWVLTIEPVTVDSLLDTALALLESLTSFCNLSITNEPPSSMTGSWLEGQSSDILNTKLPAYLALEPDSISQDRRTEIYLTRARFLTALADVSFRSGAIDIPSYQRTIEKAFSYETLSTTLATNPEGLCNQAESLISLSLSLRFLLENKSVQRDQIPQIQASRWKSLSSALTALTSATKLPTVENLVKINLTRGDVELLRYQLGTGAEEEIFAPAANNGSQLLKNSATYYRGAASYARQNAKSWEEELREAIVKEGIVEMLTHGKKLGGSAELVQKGVDIEDAERILEDCFEEGLVSKDLWDWSLKNDVTGSE